MSTPMAAVATNGTNSSQMRGKLSASAKAARSFSEELASAKDAGLVASEEISAAELTRRPKSTGRSHTTKVTTSGRPSVRGRNNEDRRDEDSKPTDAGANVSCVKASELELVNLPLQVACERVLPPTLMTETVTPQGATLSATKVERVTQGNGSSATGTEGVTPADAAPVRSATQQLSTRPLANGTEEQPSSEAHATLQGTSSHRSEDSAARSAIPEAKDGLVMMESAELLTTPDSSTEEDSIRILASFEAKNINGIPVLNPHFSSEKSLPGSPRQTKGTDQDSHSVIGTGAQAGIANHEMRDGWEDKSVLARAVGPVTHPLNDALPMNLRVTDPLHSLSIDQLRSKHGQGIQPTPNADHEGLVRSNAAFHTAGPEPSQVESAEISPRLSSEKAVRVAASIFRAASGLEEGFKSGALGSEHNSRRQQSSMASEVTTAAKDVQNQAENSTPGSQVLASATPVGTASESFEKTVPSAAKADTVAQLERTRQLVAAHSVLQTAKLTDRGGRTELHVGLTAGELGNVSIRTFMVHDQVKAEISVQKEELRNLLAQGLPEIQSKMSRTADTAPNVVFSAGANHGQGSNGSAQTYQGEQGKFPSSGSNAVRDEIVDGAIVPAEASSASAKLDIRM